MATQNDYIYAVTRIKAKELNLLDSSILDQLIESKDIPSAIRILKDKGWDIKDESEDILTNQTDELWKLIEELNIDKKELSVLFVEKDFHNLKAAIKGAYAETDVSDLFQKYGMIDIENIKEAVSTKDFTILPEYIRPYAAEAFDILFKTGDGQLADSILDKGTIDVMQEFAKKSDIPLIKEYSSLKAAISNIKIAIRGNRTGKSREFFEKFLSETDKLNKSSLINAAVISEDEIYTYLELTDFKDGIEILKTDFASFECWCDDKLVSSIKKEKYNSFTMSPIIAFIIAREMEIKNVGIILVAKRNQFENEEIKKRMRDMYV